MDAISVKRALREYRRIERGLQPASANAPSPVWDLFFDLKERGKGKAKYPLSALCSMSPEEYGRTMEAYWSAVCDGLFGERDGRDLESRLAMDLPAGADEEEIKKRFRALAKRYHPDLGGDAAKFIELMEAYRKLLRR